ncbi:citrate synthase [Deinococcus aetherius]|uniref:citrate synthase (unknown stereospecificity) n=1 Tax=Deinococcus aetherius TaxID=200252 RepID=A0ABN6RAZ0_9DEIO|nr:citrate synthase family protein [Deinococcus aetherius]BDP40513.1 citrate synthase [Deinococcus aetherius]
MSPSLSAAEATERLGVSRATLYAYVSRGLIRSEPAGGKTRERRYRAEDVDALVRRKEERRDPGKTAQGALNWGAPVLESELTLISGGRLYYRGHDAVRLAEDRTLEEVAGLLWTGELRAVTLPLRAQFAHLPLVPEAGLLESFAHALTHAGARDLHASDARPEALPGNAARVLSLLFAVTERACGIPAAPDLALHERLARAWGVGNGHADLLRRALILTADHELNLSSFTARCVASSGASLHHAALGALCALQGVRHGLSVEVCSELLDLAGRQGARRALSGVMRRFHRPPGFGHLLYPGGDPRGRALLDHLALTAPDLPALHVAQTLCEEVRRELGERPNVDLALALVVQVLGGPAERGVALFALGRTVGWLAHGIESAAQGRLIRPRAKYVGALPGPT